MADAEKPYRLYKGGRTRGKVPTAPRPERPGRWSRAAARQPGKPRWGRRIGLAVLVLGVLLIVWLVASYLAFRSGVEEANARLPKTVEASLAPQDGLLALEAVADHAARHRRRQDRRAPGLPPLRLDPARPHRPEAAPDGVPLDPARPARRHPRPRAEQDQRRLPARRAGADDEDGARADGPAAEPRRPRRLRQLQGGDRRARRRRDRRAEADPLQPLRLPLRDRGALPAVAGLALREGEADDGRQARADLLARPREPARPGRERPHARRAAAGGRRGDDEQARLRRHVREAAVHRRRPRQAAGHRSLRRPAPAARLGPLPLEREPFAALPPRRRAAVDRRRSPCSSAARRTAPRSRCSPAARPRSRRLRGRRSAPVAGSAAASSCGPRARVVAWGSSAGSSSGCWPARSRGR